MQAHHHENVQRHNNDKAAHIFYLSRSFNAEYFFLKFKIDISGVFNKGVIYPCLSQFLVPNLDVLFCFP